MSSSPQQEAQREAQQQQEAQPQEPAADNNKSYDYFLERLSRNASLDGSKRAMAFCQPPDGHMVTSKTYREFEAETTQLASRLLNDYDGRIKAGDCIVLVYPPCLEFTVAFVACLKAGIVAVPVFPPNPVRRDTLRMFARIVESCHAKTALTNKTYQHAKKMAKIKNVVSGVGGGIWNNNQKTTTNGATTTTTATWPEHLEWIVTDAQTPESDKKKSKSKDSTATIIEPSTKVDDPNRLAFLQYTSGSTSDPKGVMITHGNLAHNLHCITSELKADKTTVVVSWLPQYHDMGLIGSLLGCLYCGGSGYYMSPLHFLQRPALWMECLSKFQATHVQAPNFAYRLASRKWHSANSSSCPFVDFSSVRHMINAAEPVDEASMETFYDTFSSFGLPRGVIYPTYGLAEHTVFVCTGGKLRLTVRTQDLEVDGKVVVVVADDDGDNDNGKKDDNKDHSTSNHGDDKDNTASHHCRRLVGCGIPPENLGIIVRIVNPDTFAACPEDVVGEVWIRSPSKAAGYYGRPEETAWEFHAKIKQTNNDTNDGDDNDGYLRTGDLGFVHAKEVFITGRRKDLIIVGGRNYYPQDLEATAEQVACYGATPRTRPGCTAAFTVDPLAGAATPMKNDAKQKKQQGAVASAQNGGERVALLLELREDTLKQPHHAHESLARDIRAAITKEHSLAVAVLVLLKPRTIPKTSSGKIARAWCRKGLANGTLQVVYRHNFDDGNGDGDNNIAAEHNPQNHLDDSAALDDDTPEHDDDDGKAAGGAAAAADKPQTPSGGGKQQLSEQELAQVRGQTTAQIANLLAQDVSLVSSDGGGGASSLPAASIKHNVALATVMDSLTMSQFKGYVESKYRIKTLSDEYLFRETTTLIKLAEVVKLGYAPDDDNDDNNNGGGDVETGRQPVTSNAPPSGRAKGLAGALGCPPGVVCCTIS